MDLAGQHEVQWVWVRGHDPNNKDQENFTFRLSTGRVLKSFGKLQLQESRHRSSRIRLRDRTSLVRHVGRGNNKGTATQAAPSDFTIVETSVVDLLPSCSGARSHLVQQRRCLADLVDAKNDERRA